MQKEPKAEIRHGKWWAKITKKRGSKRLYVKIFYLNKYVEKSTGLLDTKENRKKLEPIVDKINIKMFINEFVFAEAFPGASERDKRYFTLKESREYRPHPSSITFKRALEEWRANVFDKIQSNSIKKDYNSAINPRIIPFFEHFLFDEIATETIKEFLLQLKREKNGKMTLLTAKTMKNILTPLKGIRDYTINNYDWSLKCPFKGINTYIDEITGHQPIQIRLQDLDSDELSEKMHILEEMEKQPVRVIRFRDYIRILKHMDPHHRPSTELMFLTGMIPSEVAALRRNAIMGDMIKIAWSYSRGYLKDKVKNKYRIREIPKIKAICRVLDEALLQNHEPFIYRSKTGSMFSESVHRKAWYKACDAAGIERIVPYCSRHSFVAYSELMGVHKSKLIGLMGHADKSMIDRVYGKYTDGLEKDLAEMKAYYGEDYWS